MARERGDVPDLSSLSPTRRQLVAELAHLRSLTGRGLRPFGTKAGLSFSRVRRIEQGEALPSIPEVRGWLTAAGVTDDDHVQRILALTQTAHTRTSPWAPLLAESRDRHLNGTAAHWERTSLLVCSYQQMVVPGLAQTETYTRALQAHLPIDQDVDAHVAALMRRQDTLHDVEHRFRFVLTRRAWTWSPDPSTQLMAAQHDRLRRAADIPGVEVRVLEDDATPMGGYSSFTIYDERTGDEPPFVMIEIEKGAAPLDGEDIVEHYRRRFGQLWDAAGSVGQ